MVESSGLRVQGLVFRVRGSELRVEGVGCVGPAGRDGVDVAAFGPDGVCPLQREPRVQGFRLRVWDLGFGVWDLGFGFWGLGFRGLGFEVWG